MLAIKCEGESSSDDPFLLTTFLSSSTLCIPIKTDSALVTQPLQARQSFRLISAVSSLVRSRGFFESLFGGEERREPLPQLPPKTDADAVDDEPARGGSQAVCVRTCDGGFFPLGISARRGKENLVEMCQALCPGAETEVFTRRPDADIKTAASLDGKSYTELPNALKFEKSFVPTCTCRQPGKTWAETLANAEEVLGATRKGDVVVTKEKSDEMSRPRLDPKAVAAALAKDQAVRGAPTRASAADAAKIAGAAADGDADAKTGGIRKVGPQP